MGRLTIGGEFDVVAPTGVASVASFDSVSAVEMTSFGAGARVVLKLDARGEK
jgi:hypothetical protein